MARVLGDLDELLASVQHAAHAEAQEITRKAEQQAEDIRQRASEQAEAQRKSVLDRARRKAGSVREKQRAGASQEQKRRFLESREKLLVQVWEAAAEQLNQLSEDEDRYADALGRLVKEALAGLGPGKFVLQSCSSGQQLLNEQRLEDWSRQAGEELAIEVALERASEPLDNRKGLVVFEKDGRRSVDFSFETRLEFARQDARAEVFRRLMAHE